MKKTYKVWLKIAGIISICFASIVVFGCICMSFNFFGTREIFENALRHTLHKNPNKSDIDFMRFVTIGEMVLGCVINIYSGILQISLSKKEYIVVGSTRLLINISIFQLLFTVNIFSAIISCVIGIKLNQSVWNNKQNNTKSIDSVAHEVEKLRLLRDNGAISEEQWNAELNRLLEEYSRWQNNNKFK